MSVKILIITHENIGSALLNVALKTFGKLPLPALVVPIHYNNDPEAICSRINFLVTNLNNPDGILVLTDLFGSTPNNIARSLQNNFNVRVVSGVNLPMIIRVMNYPHLPLSELAEKAISGGRDGVLNCAECVG